MARPKIAEEKKYLTLSFRLDLETLRFIDDYTAHLNTRFVGLQADKSTAVRMLLQLGIEAVKAGHDPATPGGQLTPAGTTEDHTPHDAPAPTVATRPKVRAGNAHATV